MDKIRIVSILLMICVVLSFFYAFSEGWKWRQTVKYNQCEAYCVQKIKLVCDISEYENQTHPDMQVTPELNLSSMG